MTRSTIIKAAVAGSVVVAGILLGDSELVRTRLGRTMDIFTEVEKAIKNPFGTLASSMTTSRHEPMGYYDWMNRNSEREYEMKRLQMQHEHEERMAQISATGENHDEQSAGKEASA